MNETTRTRTVAGSARQVWNTLADFGAISAWAPSVDHSCLLYAASALGCADRRGPGPSGPLAGGEQEGTSKVSLPDSAPEGDENARHERPPAETLSPDPAQRRGGIGAVRRIQMGRTTVLERVLSWDEPKSLSYAIEGLPPVVKSVINEWRLEPAGDAATEVSITSRVDCGPRPPQQIIAHIVGRRLAKESDALLAGLAQSLAAPTGAAGARAARRPKAALSGPDGALPVARRRQPLSEHRDDGSHPPNLLEDTP